MSKEEEKKDSECRFCQEKNGRFSTETLLMHWAHYFPKSNLFMLLSDSEVTNTDWWFYERGQTDTISDELTKNMVLDWMKDESRAESLRKVSARLVGMRGIEDCELDGDDDVYLWAEWFDLLNYNNNRDLMKQWV
jgi:hypothetical protein